MIDEFQNWHRADIATRARKSDGNDVARRSKGVARMNLDVS